MVITVMSRLYSSSRSFVDAINSPPLLIQPGWMPVSASRVCISWRLVLNSSTSMSFGRRLQTRPYDDIISIVIYHFVRLANACIVRPHHGTTYMRPNVTDEIASLSVEAYLHTNWHFDRSSRLARTDGRKLEAVALWGAGSPSNTMWPTPRPTFVPSGILIHPTV